MSSVNPNLPKPQPQPSQAELENFREQARLYKQGELSKESAPPKPWAASPAPSPLVAENAFKESPESLAARTKVMASQEPPKANDQKSPETNEQTNSPGAEPPKNPNNNDAAKKAKREAREQEVLAEWEQASSRSPSDPRLLGSSERPITSNEARILIKHGVKNFKDRHFETGVQLNGLDLSAVDFSSAKMSEANFANSKMLNCSFNSTQLVGANFKASELKICQFERAALLNSSFRNSTLSYVNFTLAELIRSDLSNAAIEYSNFEMARMQLSNWQKAKIEQEVSFYRCNFTGEDFRLANKETLEKANFRASDCSHANFAGIELPVSSFFDQQQSGIRTTAKNANFKGTVFCRQSNKPGEVLHIDTANFAGSDFEGADLRRVLSMSRVEFIGTSLRDVKTNEIFILSNCDIRLSDLRGTDFKNWTLLHNEFFNCKLDNKQTEFAALLLEATNNQGLIEGNTFRSGLQGINLEGANLANAVIEAHLDFTNLRNANFGSEQEGNQTRFVNLRNDGHELRFADLRGSNIENAIFEGESEILAYGASANKESDFLSRTNTVRQNHGIDYRSLFNHRDLSNRNLKDLSLNNATFIGLDFTDSDLEGSDFLELNLVNPIFSNNNLKHSEFEKVNLSKTAFEACNLEGAGFKITNLQECRFDDSNLKDTKFTDSNLKNANLLNTISLENADLSFDDVAFAAGGHRNGEGLRERTRELYKQRGCDLGKKSGEIKKSNEGEDKWV